MIKRTVTFTDLEGNPTTEELYFHFSKAEMFRLETETPDGGFSGKLQAIVNSGDNKQIYDGFKDIITRAYGQKSEDGKRFVKNAEAAKEFGDSEAFNEFFFELATDMDAITNFVNELFPPAMIAEMQASVKKNANLRPDGRPMLHDHLQKAVPASKLETVEVVPEEHVVIEGSAAEELLTTQEPAVERVPFDRDGVLQSLVLTFPEKTPYEINDLVDQAEARYNAQQ